jgi:hypothetical protein
VKQVTKARLFTLLMIAVLVAMIVARLHPIGLSDGGYW